MSDALDTGGPQGPPPTSPSEKSGSGGGGAGVDLDRLTEDLEFACANWGNDQDVAFPLGEIRALVSRVRVLEAVAEAARELNRVQTAQMSTATEWSNSRRRLTVALAAAGGGDRHE